MRTISRVRAFPAPIYIAIILIYFIISGNNGVFYGLIVVGLFLSLFMYRRTILYSDRIEVLITIFNLRILQIGTYNEQDIYDINYECVGTLATGDSGYAIAYNINVKLSNGNSCCICSLQDENEAMKWVDIIKIQFSLNNH